jgi:hypothetical protein
VQHTTFLETTYHIRISVVHDASIKLTSFLSVSLSHTPSPSLSQVEKDEEQARGAGGDSMIGVVENHYGSSLEAIQRAQQEAMQRAQQQQEAMQRAQQEQEAMQRAQQEQEAMQRAQQQQIQRHQQELQLQVVV